MGIIIGFLIGILVLCALLLVIIILMQDDGSEGAGIIFGSAASQQYGVRKGNIVTRTTGILATLFMVLAFVLAFFLTDSGGDVKSLQEIAEKKQSTNNNIKWWEASESTDIDERDTEPASERDTEPVSERDTEPVSASESNVEDSVNDASPADDKNNSSTSSPESQTE